MATADPVYKCSDCLFLHPSKQFSRRCRHTIFVWIGLYLVVIVDEEALKAKPEVIKLTHHT